jgi:hypothetical protein
LYGRINSIRRKAVALIGNQEASKNKQNYKVFGRLWVNCPRQSRLDERRADINRSEAQSVPRKGLEEID